ncbi:MAG: disulfide bond formation protein B [Rubellimicrobium sp.]|nr:disulfide bond formation protein B [Rubellimicrobium sp.]
MTRDQTIVLAAGGSAALLAGAFLFQAIGLAPCQLCIWQRWPHALAILIGVLALTPVAVLSGRALAGAGAAITAVSVGLGLYHTGVERAWWDGPTSCAGGPGLTGLSGAELLSLEGPRIILCTEVAWSMLGLSMASWNALLSLALMGLWILAARTPG